MSYFKELKDTIESGITGVNKGHSLGMPRLDKYINLRRKMFYVLMGSTGSGKSSFLNNCFILNPLEANKDNNLKYIFFSMERNKSYLFAKWLIRRIFLDEGKIVPMHTLLNWYGDKLTDEALKLIDRYEDYFDFLEKHIDIYEGGRSPNDIFRIVKGYADENGEETEVNKYKKIYTPNDKNEEVVVVIDHIGLTKTTKEHSTKKQAIDRLVETLQGFRDYLGYSCIAVNQLNRDLSNPIYTKLDSYEPHIDNAKESGTTTEAADSVISVFEPIKYSTNDKFYGDVSVFRSPEDGHKYFRNIKILKSSYGTDDAAIGTVFQGETGIYMELPKSKYIKENWKQADYQSIFDNSYFLQ